MIFYLLTKIRLSHGKTFFLTKINVLSQGVKKLSQGVKKLSHNVAKQGVHVGRWLLAATSDSHINRIDGRLEQRLYF